MPNKDECEKAIRRLCRDWRDVRGLKPEDYHSFSDFKSWLIENHYSHYLNFRSKIGADFEAEMWFADELNQTWRY